MRPTSDPRLVNAADVPDQIGPDTVVYDLASGDVLLVNHIDQTGRAFLTNGVAVRLDRLEILR